MIEPWDCYIGKPVWYSPAIGGKRYAAKIGSEHRKLGEAHVIRLVDLDPEYVREHHPGSGRNSVPAASLDAIDARDMIDELCQSVRDAGLTMTLNGKPVTTDELRKHVETSADERIVDLLTRKARQ